MWAAGLLLLLALGPARGEEARGEEARGEEALAEQARVEEDLGEGSGLGGGEQQLAAGEGDGGEEGGEATPPLLQVAGEDEPEEEPEFPELPELEVEKPLRLEFNTSTAPGEEEGTAPALVEGEEEERVAAELGRPQSLVATNVTATSMLLRWAMNTSYNNIRGYRVFYKHDSYADIKTFNGQLPKFTLTGLVPYTQYNVWVRPISSTHPDAKLRDSERILQTTDTAEPSAPFITNVTCYETQKIYIEWKRPTLYYKTIDYYFVYYRAQEESEWRHHQMQADSKDDQKFFLEQGNSQLSLKTTYCIKISAGTQSTSSNVVYQGEQSSSPDSCVYLPSHGCGAGPEVTAPPSTPFPNGQLSAGVVVGAVAALLLLLMAVLGFVVWRRYCESAYYYLEDPPRVVPPVGIPDWEEEPGPEGGRGALAAEDFPAHVNSLHADSDIGFSREYDEILRYSMKSVNATHEHSSHPDNKHKNRYLNIVAYDHSRVVLSSVHGLKNSDYINANYIDGFQQFQAYIGSQGPLDETFESFWRMVWEQKVYVIVMITNLVERGRRKCDMYWPKEGSATYGHIDVTMVKEVVMANYTVRSLRVRHTKPRKKKWTVSERLVEQYHYTGWPDHGTPGDTLPVLTFVRKSVACNPADGGPIIAHCSAGVGRTGTYIAIDAMLRQARTKGELNTFGFLKHIRSQRNHLVQTEEQYVFLHDALVEALSSGVTEVALSSISDHISRLNSPVSGLDTRPLLEKQFDLVCSFAPNEYDHVAARRPCNVSKNRDPGLVPIEAARVALTAKPGVEGSDYINASWVQGYHKVKEFVITQHPTKETRDAFWTMLWDHNAQTVVLLTPITEDFAKFWPVKHEEYDLDYFKVRFIEEATHEGQATHEGHATLDFVISSRYDDYELKVRFLYCEGWPHAARALHKVLSAVSLVQDWHLEYQNGPLVLVDRWTRPAEYNSPKFPLDSAAQRPPHSLP
jgi:receptor-type tyrosine-protein phosphatase gamma